MSNGTEQIFLPDSVSIPPLDMEMMARPGNGAPTINTINLENVSDFTKVCRVCATVTDLVMPIFSGEGVRINLADKIRRHLPITVTTDDVLPLVVCYQCTSTLLATHELVACSLQADAALRTAREQHERQQRQMALDATEGIAEDQPDKALMFKAVVKSVLGKYFRSLGTEDCTLACQACSWAGRSVDHLVQHLRRHRVRPAQVGDFIRQYVTFEQPLESDDDTPAPPARAKSPAPLPSHCCPFCDCIFSSTARLGLHVSEHVDISEDSAVECCGALYSERALFVRHALAEHERAPPPGAVCRACGHRADCPSSLQEHIHNAHADDAITRQPRTDRNPNSKDQKYIPSTCPECGKKFSNKYNMAVHMRSHKEKSERIQCEACRRWYGSRGALVRHARLAHGGRLRFACGACGERFPDRSARAAHAALHAGAAPHACPAPGCGRAFRSRNSLLRHFDVHKNVRSHACRCGKAFRRRWHLQRHLKTHQEFEKPKKEESADQNSGAA